MIINQSELAKKIGVGRSTVSNWTRREPKKILLDDNGMIDTEDVKNRAFLQSKAPFLYNLPTDIEVKADDISNSLPQDNNNKPDIDTKDHFDIDSMTESEVKEHLKFFCTQNPKALLISAQYRRAEMDAQMKKMAIQEKTNNLFDRDIVTNNFLSILKFYYERRRQIPFAAVDEIIIMAMEHKEASRNKIIALLDGKFLEEIDLANKSLDNLINRTLPKTDWEKEILEEKNNLDLDTNNEND